MIGNRPRPWKVPTTPPVGDRKERIIGQNAGHEIPLEKRMSWTKKNPSQRDGNIKKPFLVST